MQLLDFFVGRSFSADFAVFLQAQLILGVYRIFARNVVTGLTLAAFETNCCSVFFFCHGRILLESM